MSALSMALAWAIETTRDRGLLTTLTIVAGTIEDGFFDRRYGTETSGVVNSDQLEAGLVNRARSARYQPTRARPFQALLRSLPLPDNSTFVDVGAGKGKVLLLAAQHPFRRVVGIEFSRTLCDQARRNIEIFRQKVRELAPIDVIEADVTQHTFRGDENVFFLYNPFDAVILGRFVENVRRSVEAHPRQVWLIYSTPLYASVLNTSGLFTRTHAVSLGGTEFQIYTNHTGGQTRASSSNP